MNDVKCKHCQRFLFVQAGTVIIEKMTCPGCKAKLNFKIINGDKMKDIRHKFVNPETEPKKKEEMTVIPPTAMKKLETPKEIKPEVS